jgi:hypothetical protein
MISVLTLVFAVFLLFAFCFQFFDSGFDAFHFLFKVGFLRFQVFVIVFQSCDFLFWSLRLWCWRIRLWVSRLDNCGWWVHVPSSSEPSSPSSAVTSAPAPTEASSISTSCIHVSGNWVACAVSCCSSSHGSVAPWSCFVSSWHVCCFTSILCLCTIYIY